MIVKATREKGYQIPMDNDVIGMVCIQHDDREQIYHIDELEYDEEQNSLSGFF
ncbi:hypothetical protein [Pedobacter nyackensis]|uniref:hypothetical protein n=1 Tax=Pedobacter nyackensis TaxID=475255 RepID=UPI00292CF9EE|nr:hypothetical protein [Pedobacter nyackensis]